MTTILRTIQDCAAALPLSSQIKLLGYAVYLRRKEEVEASAVTDEVRRSRLRTALAQAAELNPLAEIKDPALWQREQRQDRVLTGRDDPSETRQEGEV